MRLFVTALKSRVIPSHLRWTHFIKKVLHLFSAHLVVAIVWGDGLQTSDPATVHFIWHNTGSVLFLCVTFSSFSFLDTGTPKCLHTSDLILAGASTLGSLLPLLARGKCSSYFISLYISLQLKKQQKKLLLFESVIYPVISRCFDTAIFYNAVTWLVLSHVSCCTWSWPSVWCQFSSHCTTEKKLLLLLSKRQSNCFLWSEE